LLYGKLQNYTCVCFCVPWLQTPNRRNRRRKNEKISDSIIRHRYYHGNLYLAGSGNGGSRSLIIDPTISLCTETKKTQVLRPVFFCVVALAIPQECHWIMAGRVISGGCETNVYWTVLDFKRNLGYVTDNQMHPTDPVFQSTIIAISKTMVCAGEPI